MRPRSLVVRDATGLAFAYLLSAAEVVAIVISVGRQTIIEAQTVLALENLVAMIAIAIVGTLSVGFSGVALVARALDRKSIRPRKPPNITRRQSAILTAPWAFAAVVLIPLNLDGGARVLVLLVASIMFGTTAT